MRILLKSVSWSLFFLLATPGALYAQEKSRQETEKSCRNFIQRFYNRLVWDDQHPDSKRHRSRPSLSPELGRQLTAYWDADRDGVGTLDFDPIWMAQDPYAHRYVVGRVKPKNNRYLVVVHCFVDGEKQKDYMEHEVMFMNGRWVIMNIHYYYYQNDKPLIHEDLLSLLKIDRETDPKAYQKPGRKYSK